MELWDAYYQDGTPAGRDLVRGEPIPDGLYHIVCQILVRHTDGSYLLMLRDPDKPMHPNEWEASAGGSALKGEDALGCAKRELEEETGIGCGTFSPISHIVGGHVLYYSYLCETDADKASIRLQEGETVDFRWLTREEFRVFVNSDEMIASIRERYMPYLTEAGLIPKSR